MVRVHRGSPWPVGQAVKTPPFHGGIKGSIPLRVTNHGRLAQPGERLPYKQDVGGSIPSSPTILICKLRCLYGGRSFFCICRFLFSLQVAIVRL